MTLARRDSRRIVVDEVEYRWKVRGRPTYCQGLGWTPLTFVVEAVSGQGPLLVVTMPCAHPGNWLNLPSAPVLPSTVASAIRTALGQGWRSHRRSVFSLAL